jgi:dTDP-4-amino-4,6-dideoxy-D-glucose acyltransferase
MPSTSFLDRDELDGMGFKSVGHEVKISRKASFYHCENISIGSHVRIDDFCVLSGCAEGYLRIGWFVHIAAHCFIEASAGVEFMDFSAIAAGGVIYGGTDDYSGEHLTNPNVPWDMREFSWKPVLLKKHALAGASVTILPGVTMGECSCAGAGSLVTRDIPDGEIHGGVPARFLKKRSFRMLELEEQYRRGLADGTYPCPFCRAAASRGEMMV